MKKKLSRKREGRRDVMNMSEQIPMKKGFPIYRATTATQKSNKDTKGSDIPDI
jgi:hypothetical protein